MPFCGFNPKMLHGLTEFAQGLYEQALRRSEREGVPLERAFAIEVEEMNVFFAALDRRYYEELRPKHNVADAVERLVAWSAFEPTANPTP